MPNEIKINEDIKILVDGEIIGKLTSFNPSTQETTDVYQLSNESHKDLYFPSETAISGTITNVMIETSIMPRAELTVIHNEYSNQLIGWTCSETIGIGVVNARSVSSMFIKPSWQQRMRDLINDTNSEI